MGIAIKNILSRPSEIAAGEPPQATAGFPSGHPGSPELRPMATRPPCSIAGDSLLDRFLPASAPPKAASCKAWLLMSRPTSGHPGEHARAAGYPVSSNSACKIYDCDAVSFKTSIKYREKKVLLTQPDISC